MAENQTVDARNPLLGKRAKDKVTGFEGTISAVIFYLHGSTSVLLCGMNLAGSIVEHWCNEIGVDLVEDTSQGAEDSASPVMPIGPE